MIMPNRMLIYNSIIYIEDRSILPSYKVRNYYIKKSICVEYSDNNVELILYCNKAEIMSLISPPLKY